MTNPELRQATGKLASLTFADAPPGLAEGLTPLEILLSLLQGDNACVGDDTGIAGYLPRNLDRISAAAKLESDACRDRMRCLLELLDASLAAGPPTLTRATLTGGLRHLACLLSDHQRWHALANNAAYYRDHPEIARTIADYRLPTAGVPRV